MRSLPVLFPLGGLPSHTHTHLHLQLFLQIADQTPLIQGSLSRPSKSPRGRSVDLWSNYTHCYILLQYGAPPYHSSHYSFFQLYLPGLGMPFFSTGKQVPRARINCFYLPTHPQHHPQCLAHGEAVSMDWDINVSMVSSNWDWKYRFWSYASYNLGSVEIQGVSPWISHL